MSASTPKKNSFFGGAAILTAGIVIVKLIGALYKVPLGNILTDAAFADFNTAYDIYSLLIVISTGCRWPCPRWCPRPTPWAAPTR